MTTRAVAVPSESRCEVCAKLLAPGYTRCGECGPEPTLAGALLVALPLLALGVAMVVACGYVVVAGLTHGFAGPGSKLCAVVLIAAARLGFGVIRLFVSVFREEPLRQERGRE